jgi:hypothetical protein
MPTKQPQKPVKNKTVNFIFFDKEMTGELQEEGQHEVKIAGQWYPKSFLQFLR